MTMRERFALSYRTCLQQHLTIETRSASTFDFRKGIATCTFYL